ncbi:type IV pilus assembly protein PilM [Aeromonas cavernicola]|uniref:Pilus assembly protein PilM n=1 Tax=Aeromonas cavernicola TaxID=1006623 RepID=A0A2H9U9K9_9GAMM|nr:type IV pilus assembly protein PilM [Aeromonas cavernicola]PJG60726.1 pilus assembly protein PilM [Aeromonas cavernicola]
MFGLFKQDALLPLMGVDFGSQTIKAVTLSGCVDQFYIDSVAEIATPKGGLVDYQLQDIERVSQSLKSLKRLLPSNGRFVATAVTGANVITKVIQLDVTLSEKELEAQIQLEAEQIIPFPLDEVSLDFEVLSFRRDSEFRQQEILLSAARTESVNGRVTALNEAGMMVKVMDVGAHALGRAVMTCFPKLYEINTPVGVMDIGASTITFIVLLLGQVIYSRLQNFGGDTYSQAIASFYGISTEEAEHAKVKGTLPEGYEVNVLVPHISALIQQARRNVQLFCSASGYRELGQLVLTGGGSLLPGLVSKIKDEVNYEVVQPDPFMLFAKSHSDQRREDGAKYMTAFGLALRSFSPCLI